MIKGFKVFNADWTCRGFKYEVGKTYEEDVIPSVCSRGFHFCKLPKDCFNYYSFDHSNKVAEVIALGDISEKGDKCSTNKIQIIREIHWSELLSLVNMGKGNTGLGNSGDHNTGNYNTGNSNTGNSNTGNRNTGNSNTGNDNTGDHNTGYYNTGNRNTGNSNTGNSNTGNRNTGYYNTGYHNTGNYNTGDHNTGNRNTGDHNTGNYNTGDHNTGNRNTGDHNTGNSNTGNRNTGYYNTGNRNTGNSNTGDFNINNHETGCFCTENHKIRIFDVESNMTFNEWRNSDAYRLLSKIAFEPNRWICEHEMTTEEKEKHPDYKTTGGYLKICDTDKTFVDWWDNLNEKQKNIIKNIPNFNAEKFEKITGIKVD